MFSDQTLEHGFIDHGEDMKKSSKHNWTEHEYHVQDRKDIQHKSVKCHMLQHNFKHYKFVVHMKKPME